MPNGIPDPQCRECKGTGEIILLISSSECDCVNSEPTIAAVSEELSLSNFSEYLKVVKNFKTKPFF